MANKRTYPLRGDPCLRCPERRPGQQPLPATHHGCCAMCWAGSTQHDRVEARLDEMLTPLASDVRARVDAERDAAFEAWGRL